MLENIYFCCFDFCLFVCFLRSFVSHEFICTATVSLVVLLAFIR